MKEPWTRWQGNEDSPLMVIGNEFGDRQTFKDNDGLPALDAPTNVNIFYLLHLIGIPIPTPPAAKAEAKMPEYGRSSLLLFTNAILHGEKRSDLKARLQKYKAVLIVTAGKEAYERVSRLTMTPPRRRDFREARGELLDISKGRFLYPVCHPSAPCCFHEQVCQWKNLGHLVRCDSRLQEVKSWLEHGCRFHAHLCREVMGHDLTAPRLPQSPLLTRQSRR